MSTNFQSTLWGIGPILVENHWFRDFFPPWVVTRKRKDPVSGGMGQEGTRAACRKSPFMRVIRGAKCELGNGWVTLSPGHYREGGGSGAGR